MADFDLKYLTQKYGAKKAQTIMMIGIALHQESKLQIKASALSS